MTNYFTVRFERYETPFKDFVWRNNYNEVNYQYLDAGISNIAKYSDAEVISHSYLTEDIVFILYKEESGGLRDC